MSARGIPLTVAIPTYNRGDKLLPLLQAIAAQTSSEDELLVFDDGSTDSTAAVVGKIPAFCLRRHERNQGMVANWNSCLATATREWICLVHDDDVLAPDGLAILRRACALAGGPALILHRKQGVEYDAGFRYAIWEPGPWAILNFPTIPSGAIVHRSIIESLGVFDPHFRYSSDLEYFGRICAHYPLVIIESPAVVEYRLHDSNYQLETWRQPDFYSQLEEIERRVLNYARLPAAEAERLFYVRMTGYLRHMFNQARRTADRELIRRVGKRLWIRRHLNWRTRALALAGMATGFSLRYDGA